VEKGPYVYYLRGRVPHVYRISKDLKDFAKSNQTEKYRRAELSRKLTEFIG